MSAILLIEDDEDERELIAQHLTLAGYDVVLAANGEEGIRCLHAQRPDLVITDLFMPQKDGIEIIIEIRKTNSSIPIIAISGGPRKVSSGDDLTIQSLLSSRVLGANYTLSKPFWARELLNLMEHALRDKRTALERSGDR